MAGIVTDRVIDANTRMGFWELTQAQQDELRDWARVHDFDPNLTQSLELDVLDCPLVRAVVYSDPLRMAGDDIDTYVVERALRQPQPDWWQPAD